MTPLSMYTSRSETHIDTQPFASDERWLVGNFEACTFCRATFRAVSEVNSVMFVISDRCKVTASQGQSRTYAAKRLDLTKVLKRMTFHHICVVFHYIVHIVFKGLIEQPHKM